MMRERTLGVTVRDSVLDPDAPQKVAEYRRTTHDKTLYRVFLYLDGSDLPFVQSVTYQLHETFTPNVRRVPRTVGNPRCKIEIWTWGVFTVHAIVEDKRGGMAQLTHRLEYVQHLKEPDIVFRAS